MERDTERMVHGPDHYHPQAKLSTSAWAGLGHTSKEQR